MFAFVRQTQAHAGFNAGRNVDGNRALTIGPLTALAGRAGFRDDMSRTFALAARPADTEEALLKPDLACALTTGAGLHRRGRFGTAAFAIAARLPAGDLEFGFFAVD